MKILLLSFHFPPEAPLAATRAPKLARYLMQAGHDLRVLCANDPQICVAHESPLDSDRLIRTEWRDLRAIPANLLDVVRPPRPVRAAATEPGLESARPARRSLRNRVADFYDSAVCRPDRRLGWRGPALRAAKRLFESWVPDVIYATCPPHSTAVIAERIARLRNIPFFIEFRDRWAMNAYSDHPGWRSRMDERDEARVLSRATGIVTVSPLWAADYAQRYGEDRVTLSMNGYDPETYPLASPVPPNGDRDTLHLLHAGALYPNRRDPRVLFAGIAQLGQNAKHIQVTMMGKDIGPARQMAQEAGIEDQVTLLPPEPHTRIVERQYAADALALLQWNDARDAGTVPGKLFEAIGARRPVIATGYATGVTAGIIRQRGLGTIANEPAVIANALATLLTRKRSVGVIPPLPESVRDGYSCAEQFAPLDLLFHEAAEIQPMLAAAE